MKKIFLILLIILLSHINVDARVLHDRNYDVINPAIKENQDDTISKLIDIETNQTDGTQATKFVDENGTPYGVSHANNKPRVSSMPYLFDIAEGNVPNHYGLNKFGHSDDADANEEIWDGEAVYEYLDDDVFATMYISSDNGADTSITYEVQGLNNSYEHTVQEVTTDASDGNTFVALTGTWWRIYRVKCVKAVTNTKDACAAGNVYISKDNTDVGGDGIPDTATDIQAKVLPSFNQTEMAMWSVPNTNNIFYLTSFYVGAVTNQDVHIGVYVREFGKPRLNKRIIVVNNNTAEYKWEVPLAIPAKSDI